MSGLGLLILLSSCGLILNEPSTASDTCAAQCADDGKAEGLLTKLWDRALNVLTYQSSGLDGGMPRKPSTSSPHNQFHLLNLIGASIKFRKKRHTQPKGHKSKNQHRLANKVARRTWRPNRHGTSPMKHGPGAWREHRRRLGVQVNISMKVELASDPNVRLSPGTKMRFQKLKKKVKRAAQKARKAAAEATSDASSAEEVEVTAMQTEAAVGGGAGIGS
eukprot:gnl/MRDRNA2_/MRDRNA2_17280_c0_seq1.p1 gnl/MRDRNA2_/MRDRNA2_17280_c0~~gnl/MRDRNA2_/MRDRNA2_17280_c0_seq1.p1  ORF type:complete len:219 (+),score=37.71 gnl/MRDRNA2_/MRDRNA2_17280_c0_seq1:58-714(+)